MDVVIPWLPSMGRGLLTTLWLSGLVLVIASVIGAVGGLAIVGDTGRNISMHDATSGKLLYQTRLPGGVTGFPISYAVRGKQYFAVPVKSRDQVGGNAVFVFALPDAAARGATSAASR